MTSLLQYVKAEQKDRVHTINRYEHVEESDPVEAEAQRSTVAAHLRGIDERVTQAIDMLARLPRFQRKIRAQIGQLICSSCLAFCLNWVMLFTVHNTHNGPTRCSLNLSSLGTYVFYGFQ